MKVNAIINRLKYLSSFLSAYTAVFTVFYITAFTVMARTTAYFLIIFFKSVNRKKRMNDYFHAAVFYPAFGLLKDFMNEIKNDADKDFKSIPNMLLGIPEIKDRLLYSEKICTFQRNLYSKLFRSWFEIKCSEKDLDILSRHSSPAYIGMEIERLAGTSRKKHLHKSDLEKITFAYRTYLHILRIHLGFTGLNPVEGNIVATKRMKKLYPESILKIRIYMNKSRIVLVRDTFLQKIKLEKEYISFLNLLNMHVLLMTEKTKGENDG